MLFNFIYNCFALTGVVWILNDIGNMYTIKKMNMQVVSLSGATVIRKDMPYQSGTIDLSNLPSGAYIVTITSNDRKYQSTKKIIKN